jgi:hypothetical protein
MRNIHLIRERNCFSVAYCSKECNNTKKDSSLLVPHFFFGHPRHGNGQYVLRQRLKGEQEVSRPAGCFLFVCIFLKVTDMGCWFESDA